MKFGRYELVAFHPDGSPVSRWVRFRSALHNWTRVAILVSKELATGWTPPKRFRLAHRNVDMWAYWYAIPPFHWIMRLWDHIGGRWCLHRLALRIGALELEEGGYYADGKLRWPLVTKNTMEIGVAVAKISGRAKGKEIGYREGYRAGTTDTWAEIGRISLIREALELARKDEWHA